MADFFQRVAAPVLRLTTVRAVDHQRTFDEFAQNLGVVLVERRAREEPRVVSFPRRRAL